MEVRLVPDFSLDVGTLARISSAFGESPSSSSLESSWRTMNEFGVAVTLLDRLSSRLARYLSMEPDWLFRATCDPILLPFFLTGEREFDLNGVSLDVVVSPRRLRHRVDGVIVVSWLNFLRGNQYVAM